MNQNSFISLRIGQRTLFTHPLSQLKQISSTTQKKKIKKNNNERNNLINFDVIPKFIQTKYTQKMNQEFSQKLINKHQIFNKIKNNYFSKYHPDFVENIKNIENEMNNLQNSINKNNITIDYKTFKEMLNIINNNKTNDKIKSYQKITTKNFININNEIKTDILDSINLNKKIFSQIIGLNKINPKINQFSKSLKKNIDKTNSSYKNLNNIETTNSNINTNNIEDDNNIEKEHNTEPDSNYNNKMNQIITVTNEQIELFKTFVGNYKLSNTIILSYFDMNNPKVKFAAEKYFKSRYGSDYITLNFVYPIKPPGTIQHKFKFVSDIKVLFFTAQKDFSINIHPKLFLENGKELINNRKIKCIGALNLNNNSVIKVYKN